ncbi:MAG: LysM peptidoglycan-binding domain-containing protein [Muribaculum sp.]|nr:LysM peptidoglycan-binding domain-containing protein [Muribaculum sp.]
MTRKTILLSLALLASATSLSAANPNVNDIKTSVTDDAIVFPESFEQDTQKLLEGWYMRNYTATDDNFSKKKDVDTSDEVIKRRLAQMPTVIEMPFNSVVRQYIDRYTKTSRPQVAAILGLSLYYMPIFEQALEERGLPQELKYLPVIESGLDPNAVSKHGATGLWQLMLATGKGCGLDCNSLVDERRDPYASSRAAADLLKQLFDTYGDWSLAIAAYNSGPTAVNKAIRRAGIDAKKADFWNIYNYLSDETRGYVPMFIAANYVMTYYPEHNISPVLPTKPLVTDTIGVTDRVHFDQISAVLGIPIDELRILNPQYREDIIPGTPERAYMITLPSKQVHAYLMSHDQILAYEADKYAHRLTVEPGAAPQADATEHSGQNADNDLAAVTRNSVAKDFEAGAPVTVSHKVTKGETLASIAAKYGVQASEIRSTNGLRRNAVRVGQILTIANVAPDKAAEVQTQEIAESNRPDDKPAVETKKQTPVKKETASRKSKSKSTKASSGKATTHTIKSGENLGKIARKYGVTVDAIKKANGMKNDNIRAGKTLTIPAKKGKS